MYSCFYDLELYDFSFNFPSYGKPLSLHHFLSKPARVTKNQCGTSSTGSQASKPQKTFGVSSLSCATSFGTIMNYISNSQTKWAFHYKHDKNTTISKIQHYQQSGAMIDTTSYSR